MKVDLFCRHTDGTSRPFRGSNVLPGSADEATRTVDQALEEVKQHFLMCDSVDPDLDQMKSVSVELLSTARSRRCGSSSSWRTRLTRLRGGGWCWPCWGSCSRSCERDCGGCCVQFFARCCSLKGQTEGVSPQANPGQGCGRKSDSHDLGRRRTLAERWEPEF